LNASGNNFSFINDNLKLSVGRFHFKDQDHSEINDMRLEDKTAADSLLVILPSIGLTADLNSIMNGSVKATAVEVNHPFIRLKSVTKENSSTESKRKLPDVSIDNITIRQPDILLDQPGHNGFTKIEWHSKEGKDNQLQLKKFRVTEQSAISADELLFSLHNFSFAAGGKNFNAGNGEISTQVNGFSLRPNDIGEWDWHGTVTSLQAKNFLLDSIGKKAGRLEITTARLSKLAIGTSSLLNFRQMVKDNASFRLDEVTGSYKDTSIHLAWQNAGYDRFTKTFTLDSFSYHPALNKDDFSCKTSIPGRLYDTAYRRYQRRTL
jgi:hypothetical protein